MEVDCKLRSFEAIRDNLTRWGIELQVRKFRFEQALDSDDAACVRALLRAPAVEAWLGAVKDDVLVPLRTTATSMNLFDPLDGPIAQCAEVLFDGVPAHDVLRRRLMVLECATTVDGVPCDAIDDDDLLFEDDISNLPDDRDEFLFHIFSLLAIGGAMCQHDVDLDAYLATTKALYRDLVTVYRSAATGEPAISTRAFRVYAKHLFLTDNRLQRCYVLLERRNRTATLVYHSMASWGSC